MRALAILAVLAISSQPFDSAQGRQTFRSGVDLTTFGVTVTDKKGALVTNLSKDDFEIVEDGKQQAIQFFARGDADVAPELHLGLLLDTSGSMVEELRLARSAAVRFLNLLPEAEDITLVDFDDRSGSRATRSATSPA